MTSGAQTDRRKHWGWGRESAQLSRDTTWMSFPKPNSFFTIFAMSAVTLAVPFLDDSTALPLLM